MRSLALATDLRLAATNGIVIDRGDYIAVATPDNPTYCYGTYLALPAPPQVGEAAYWMRRFTEEHGGNPLVRHVTLRWDGIAGELGAGDELIAAGFTVELHQAMTARDVTAPRIELEIRPLEPQELRATADLALAIGDDHTDHYRQFLIRRAVWQRSLVERGLARFWGAFDGALVGSLGIVPLGKLARYQDVQVASTYRKRGIASALLAVAARHARETGAEQMVIVAEPGSDAARVYERAGFRFTEHAGSACLRRR
ncbi:MAG: GNAT family N-acetyltransferase [Kofleriaceae bacterium]